MLNRACRMIAMLTLVLAACTALKGGYGVPAKHPEKLSGRAPLCSACHKDASGSLVYQSFDHTFSFNEAGHGVQARQQELVCAMCHDQSACSDCHANRLELKPSTRHFSAPYRQMPHRGDYRTRHQIDGRLDPVSCLNCHGNPKAAVSCAPCHGK